MSSVGFKFASQVKVCIACFELGGCLCYRLSSQEEHGQPLFGVQFNWWLEKDKVFATVGSNRVHMITCMLQAGILSKFLFIRRPFTNATMMAA